MLNTIPLHVPKHHNTSVMRDEEEGILNYLWILFQKRFLQTGESDLVSTILTLGILLLCLLLLLVLIRTIQRLKEDLIDNFVAEILKRIKNETFLFVIVLSIVLFGVLIVNEGKMSYEMQFVMGGIMLLAFIVVMPFTIKNFSSPLSQIVPPSTHAYALKIIARNAYINESKYKDVAFIYNPFNESRPFCMGREFFQTLPAEICTAISRKHFEILCSENKQTKEKQYWITNFSSVGTYLNGVLIPKEERKLLQSGDRIGILVHKLDTNDIKLGYQFITGEKLAIALMQSQYPNSPLKSRPIMPNTPTRTTNLSKTAL